MSGPPRQLPENEDTGGVGRQVARDAVSVTATAVPSSSLTNDNGCSSMNTDVNRDPNLNLSTPEQSQSQSDYLKNYHNHQQHQHQNQHQPQDNSMMGPVSPEDEEGSGRGASPLNANVNVTSSFSDPSTCPWTIGTTDGSFAIVNLMHREQELQQQQRQISSINTDSDTTGNVAKNANTRDNTITGKANRNSEVASAIANSMAVVQRGRSLYHDKLFHQSSSSVEAVLSASCEVMGFDIAEMWLRTGPKTHQLTNSHLRPTSLEDSVRQDLVEVYYGDKSNERTHRLSPALCKRAKDANDVVWVTAHTPNGAEALRMSISNVRTAVAVPVCHEASNTNVTIIYFSIRRIVLRPTAVEFLVHVSLSATVASVNTLSLDGLIDQGSGSHILNNDGEIVDGNVEMESDADGKSRSEHGVPSSTDGGAIHGLNATAIYHQRANRTSITGARLDLQWRQLLNVEYLTDGGNSWIHTAIFDGKPVVVKTLRPECQDTAIAINEIEAEVAIHARLNHPNVVSVIGAGWTSKKVRFIVLERLDGGTLTQRLGYDTRIRDRRRRFWKKKQLPYLDVLRCARSLACALQYCHEQAIPGSMVLHRDLKPDNIGFTLDGKVKLIDFGLARMLENANPTSDDKYDMSGETGSLRYMAPEVAEGLPYNHKADVYSFGIILWEMNAGKRPFNGLSRDSFYEQIVHGGGRPSLNKKWPSELNKLISSCWSADIDSRPTFRQIIFTIDDLLISEKTGGKTKGKKLPRLSGLIDRHSTWF